jgi:hypothetical protein
VFDETRAMSLLLLHTLFIEGRESEVKWEVKEGGVLAVIRRVREKDERNRDVLCCGCLAADQFLHLWSSQIRRVRGEWKGKKEWREVMWMMEEEGEIDSVCAGNEAYGGFFVKDVLRMLGLCCPESHIH